eukprot:SAG22_NODE_15451_length_348_cov_1.232932_1_plen_58_part_10
MAVKVRMSRSDSLLPVTLRLSLLLTSASAFPPAKMRRISRPLLFSVAAAVAQLRGGLG